MSERKIEISPSVLGANHFLCVFALYAAIHLDENITTGFFNHGFQFGNFRNAVLPQALSAESRLNRHHQRQIAQREQRLNRLNRRKPCGR